MKISVASLLALLAGVQTRQVGQDSVCDYPETFVNVDFYPGVSPQSWWSEVDVKIGGVDMIVQPNFSIAETFLLRGTCLNWTCTEAPRAPRKQASSHAPFSRLRRHLQQSRFEKCACDSEKGIPSSLGAPLALADPVRVANIKVNVPLMDRLNQVLDWIPTEGSETPFEALARIYASLMRQGLAPEDETFEEIQVSVIVDTVEAVSAIMDLADDPPIDPVPLVGKSFLGHDNQEALATTLDALEAIRNSVRVHGAGSKGVSAYKQQPAWTPFTRVLALILSRMAPAPTPTPRVPPAEGAADLPSCSQIPRSTASGSVPLMMRFLPRHMRDAMLRQGMNCTNDYDYRFAYPGGVFLGGKNNTGSVELGSINTASFVGNYYGIVAASGLLPTLHDGVIGLGRLGSIPANKHFLSNLFQAANTPRSVTVQMIPDGEDRLIFGNYDDFLSTGLADSISLGVAVTVPNWVSGPEWNVKADLYDITLPQGVTTMKTTLASHKAIFDPASPFNWVHESVLDRIASVFVDAEEKEVMGHKAYAVDMGYCMGAEDMTVPNLRMLLADQVELTLSGPGMVHFWDGGCYLAFLAHETVQGEVFGPTNPRRLKFGRPFFHNYATTFNHGNDTISFRPITIVEEEDPIEMDPEEGEIVKKLLKNH